jgi:hypothetical protein
MKLRIKGNSLRLRVSPSDLERLLSAGRVEEIIRFTQEPDATLTYALEQTPSRQEISVRYRPQEITVVLSTESARNWADGEQVGIYGSLAVGSDQLALAVEKDFACLDGNDASNEDTFANPKTVPIC